GGAGGRRCARCARSAPGPAGPPGPRSDPRPRPGPPPPRRREWRRPSARCRRKRRERRAAAAAAARRSPESLPSRRTVLAFVVHDLGIDHIVVRLGVTGIRTGSGGGTGGLRALGVGVHGLAQL